jgi:cytochrome c
VNGERRHVNAKSTQLALGVTLLVWAGAVSVASAAGVDEDAALALARKDGCLKCHSTTRDKEGPSYKKVAEKFKGKADAEQELTKFLTSPSKIKVDGKEEMHKQLTGTDPAAVKNLVGWILTR